MSQAELDRLIARIQKEFSTWGHGISVPEMRESWDRLFTDVRELAPVKRQAVSAGGVPAEWLDGPGARPDRAVLYLHGGGYVLGGVDSHRDLIARLSAATGARGLGLDYRLAPEHPFPAAVEDAVARTASCSRRASRRSTSRSPVTPRAAGSPPRPWSRSATAGCRCPPPRRCSRRGSTCEGTGESINGGVADDPMVAKDLVALMATHLSERREPARPAGLAALRGPARPAAAARPGRPARGAARRLGPPRAPGAEGEASTSRSRSGRG